MGRRPWKSQLARARRHGIRVIFRAKEDRPISPPETVLALVSGSTLRELLNRRVNAQDLHVIEETFEEALRSHLAFAAKAPVIGEHLSFGGCEERGIALVGLRASFGNRFHALI